MDINKAKNNRKIARRRRVRAKISGTSDRPRLSVSRSNTGMYVQLIDDIAGKTLASAHTREIKEKGAKVALSLGLGKLIAEKAKAIKISEVVFDKGGNRYHGRIKALADGAREGGLKF